MNGPRLIALAARTLAFAALLCGSTACTNPVLGEWQSDQKLANGERNELWLYEDSTGEATIYATPADQPDTWIRFDFELDWEEFKGSEFDLELECDDADCDGSNDDFEMDCDGVEQNGGDMFLDCNGNGKWTNYVFNWEKVD